MITELAHVLVAAAVSGWNAGRHGADPAEVTRSEADAVTKHLAATLADTEAAVREARTVLMCGGHVTTTDLAWDVDAAIDRERQRREDAVAEIAEAAGFDPEDTNRYDATAVVAFVARLRGERDGLATRTDDGLDTRGEPGGKHRAASAPLVGVAVSPPPAGASEYRARALCGCSACAPMPLDDGNGVDAQGACGRRPWGPGRDGGPVCCGGPLRLHCPRGRAAAPEGYTPAGLLDDGVEDVEIVDDDEGVELRYDRGGPHGSPTYTTASAAVRGVGMRIDRNGLAYFPNQPQDGA